MRVDLEKIERADNLLSRFLGLMGRRGFDKSQGMLLSKTNSIHTFFVFFPIDVVFLDKEMRVLKLVENMRPFWVSPIIWQAAYVLELPIGTIISKSIRVDDQINLL